MIATYADGARRGQPAITLNRFGKGSVVYVGTVLDEAGIERLVAYLCRVAGVGHGWEIPDEVSLYERSGPAERLQFILNESNIPKAVCPGAGWMNAFTGEAVDSVLLEPLGISILSQPRETG